MNRRLEKPCASRLKKPARFALTALIAAALALPLGGCFGIPDPGEVAGKAEKIATRAEEFASQAEEAASQAEELADTLSSIEWSKVSRLVVKDAATGKVVREVTDQDEIARAFTPLSGENGLAAAPDEPAEYVFELWEPETQKLGQNASDFEEYKGLEATTYKGSSVVTLEMSPIGLKLHLSSQAAANSLRALAR